MGWTEIPYNIPNLRVENGKARAHIRIGWLRSVAHIYHAFAIQTFTDELATASGRDHADYLLVMIGDPRIVSYKDMQNVPGYPIDTARLRRVTEIAAGASRSVKRTLAP